jgi:hypothetical protein
MARVFLMILLALFFVGQLHEDGVIFDFDGIGEDILARGSAQDFAGAHIELGAVPGTGENVPFQFTLVERTADVSTVVGEGIDAAFDSGKTDQFSVHFERQGATFFYVINPGYFEKLCHSLCFPI